MNQVTVGSYLAQRQEEVGGCDYFAIPGDFNLSLQNGVFWLLS